VDKAHIEDHISNYFTIKSFHTDGEAFYFIVNDYKPDKFAGLIEDLDRSGYVPFLSKSEENYKISIVERPERGKSNVYMNLVLFLATVATTIYAGYILAAGSIMGGVVFSAAIMGIFGTHETAHFFAARKHGVKVTLPYFVPAPTLIGTFGAVINVKSPIPNKNALFDLGCSGPIAGLMVTVPVLIIGIYFSTVVPVQKESILFIPPLLMSAITYFITPAIPDGYALQLHPIGFAGWVGVIVTMLNLMPVAFLDGGHISRSLFSERIHQIISVTGIIVTFILGWIPMALLMVIIFFMTKRHPGALDDVLKLSRGRKILAALILVIFILCLSPLPITSL
jgi:membrane-associated protease RseP (regulator of RpoE activity)